MMGLYGDFGCLQGGSFAKVREILPAVALLFADVRPMLRATRSGDGLGNPKHPKASQAPALQCSPGTEA